MRQRRKFALIAIAVVVESDAMRSGDSSCCNRVLIEEISAASTAPADVRYCRLLPKSDEVRGAASCPAAA